MAERTVKVNLVAQVNGYIDGMDRAARRTRELGTEAEKLAAKRQAFEALGRGLVAVGIIGVAAVALAVKRFADFDAAISNVKAVTQETAANMQLLQDAALAAGGATIFTATEAANAIEELGKAGISTADILGGALDGSLSLAASGQLEVARAAEITATTLKQFGLDGSEAAHVADVLSAGAGKALGSVEDLAQALKFVGPVAASMGISLEETTGALALFADQGLIGEQAGTSLRGVLASLTSPSSEAAKEITRLGISLYDSNGAFKGVENLAGQLGDAYQSLDDKSRDASLGIIFGNQQVTAARVLFQGGAEAVAKYTAEVNDAGYAARVAADRLDNLKGDIEKLSGAFDTVLIKQGSAANDVLRSIVQTATFLVDGISDLPEPALAAGLAITAVGAAVALTAGAALLGIPKFLALRTAMKELEISGRGASVAIGLVGGAIGLATVVLSAFIAEQAASSRRTDEFKTSLDQASGSVTKYTRELVVKRLEEKNAFADASKYGISQKELTDAVLEGGNALELVNRKIADYTDSLDVNQKRLQAGEIANSSTAIAVRTTRSEIEAAQKAYENSSAATDDNAAALRDLRGEAEDAGDAVSELADLIRGFGSATLSTRDAQRAFQAAIDDATDALAANGATTDINTEAGRQNEAALDAIAKTALEAAAAIYEETGSQENATAAIQAGRDAVIAQRIAMGDTQAQAESYADELGLIPANINTVASLDTTQARTDFGNFLRDLGGRTVAVNVAADRNFATGGYTGPGGKYEPAGVVHRGEFVSTQETTAVPANRAALEYMQRGGVISGYAGGGYVTPPASGSDVTLSRDVKVEMKVTGEDSVANGERIYQRLTAGLARL